MVGDAANATKPSGNAGETGDRLKTSDRLGLDDSLAVGRLTPRNHSDNVGDRRYVYPVVSRRAGGVSIGVNLNPNRACNYRCVYCQVPGLIRGKGPAIDLPLLAAELDDMLDWLEHGDFYAKWVPAPMQTLRDVAFSGDGEPTSSPNFAAAVATVCATLAGRGQATLPIVLITNGTLAHLPAVRAGIDAMGAVNGRVWFKLDGGRDEDIEAVNSTAVSIERLRANLRETAARCPTWVQTCAFGLDGAPPSAQWRQAWLALLRAEIAHGTPLRGVLLYSVARPSHQPEASRLLRLDLDWLEVLADEVRALGLPCEAYP